MGGGAYLGFISEKKSCSVTVFVVVTDFLLGTTKQGEVVMDGPSSLAGCSDRGTLVVVGGANQDISNQ